MPCSPAKCKEGMIQNPIKVHEVEDLKLGKFVIIPNGCELSFALWWISLNSDALVQVRYPHEQHGLAGKQSNQPKTVVKEDFLQFVDINRQPNGRRDDSLSATLYLLPKFRTIQTPRKGVHHYQVRVETSVSLMLFRQRLIGVLVLKW